MTIVYSSNTGHTKQYAELLQEATGFPTFSLDKLPAYVKGDDAIYLGWLMANRVTGLSKAQSLLNVRCVVADGMTPESEEQTASVRSTNGLADGVALFYLQGGYDFKKLKGIYKMMMKLKGKEILGRYDGKSEEEKQADPVYKMITEGNSVFSAERLAPVVEWAKGK